MPYRLRFVATPDVDAAVRLDLADVAMGAWTARDGITLSPPEFRGEPGGVGGEYDYRSLTLSLRLVTDDPLAAGAWQAKLARELMRAENWLQYQASVDSPPRWFHCYQSSPGDIGVRFAEQGVWDITVPLIADPMALGEVVTVNDGPMVVGNDPATGGLAIALPDIKGDAPAPLNIDIAPGVTNYVQPLIAVYATDTPGSLPFWQAETWTYASGTTTVTGATYSGGSAARATLPSGAARPSSRVVTGDIMVPFAGRWEVFARIAFANGVSTGTVVADVSGAGSAAASTSTVRIEPTNTGRLVSLGTYIFPKGNMPSARPYTLGTGSVGVDFFGENGSAGTVTFDVDYIVAVPIDLPLDQVQPPRRLKFTQQSRTKGDATLRLDAESETVQVVSSGAHVQTNPEVPAGAFPSVVPGASNVFIFMPRRGSSVDTGYYRDRISDTTTLTLTYRPRFLFLGSG